MLLKLSGVYRVKGMRPNGMKSSITLCSVKLKNIMIIMNCTIVLII